MAKKKTGITEVAERLGISITTVSRILNGKSESYRISKATTERVRQVAQEMGYAPNAMARSLRMNKTFTIGLIIPDISNPFFSSIARIIDHEARKAGYSIMLCDSDENTELEIHAFEILRNRMVDGIIIAPVGKTHQHLRNISDHGLPIAIIDRYFPDLHIPYVSSDNKQGGYDATRYLIAQGHRVIACLQGLEFAQPNKERINGYKQAMSEHGLPFDERNILGGDYSIESGYHATRTLLEQGKTPTAIFATSNVIAFGCMQALAEQNLEIPLDISLIAFDDQPYMSMLKTPLTTIAQQNELIGAEAFNILLDMLEKNSSLHHSGMLIPTRLIARNSVSKPRG